MPPQRRIDVVFDSVKRLQRIGATANLLNLLQKQHPADLAEVFSGLPERERRSAFDTLVERNSRLAMEAISELEPEVRVPLLVEHPAEDLARFFQDVPSDDAAAVIDDLPDALSTSVLEVMRRKESDEVQHLLKYADETAGRIMNPDVFALSEDLTAGEAIAALQQSRDVEMVFYVYVVDERRHLVGVLSLRRLLLVSPETPLKRIMTADLTTARANTDQEEVARLVASYNLLAIPVVDDENKLVGIITVDYVIDVIKDEATEDIYRMAGVSSDEHVFTSARESLRKRLPWLGVNLVTAILAALVVRLFQSTIDQVVALAAFMTIVASMGGNAATQTLTVIVRGIALGELTWSNSRRALVEGGDGGDRQRHDPRPCRGRFRLVGGRESVLWRHPGPRHGDQPARRGGGGHIDSDRAAGTADRPGACVLGVHYDADRCIRVLRVSRFGDALYRVSGPGALKRARGIRSEVKTPLR